MTFRVFKFLLSQIDHPSLFLVVLNFCLCVGFLSLQQVWATLHCGAWASHNSGFPCCGAQALSTWASGNAAPCSRAWTQ